MNGNTSLPGCNGSQRPETQVYSSSIELYDASPSRSHTADSLRNTSIQSGHTDVSRQSTSMSHQSRNFAENDQNDDDRRSELTVVTRTLRTWDVAALIINKMVGSTRLLSRYLLRE